MITDIGSSGRFAAVFGMPVVVAMMAMPCPADQELARRATWQPPTSAQVKTQLDQWLQRQDLDPATQAKIDAMWAKTGEEPGASRLDRLASTFALAHTSARDLVALCRAERVGPGIPNFPFLQDPATPEWMRNNLRLLFGQWLTRQQLYDEALAQLESLDPAQVVDPASLLFYQGAVHHRLLNKKEGLSALDRLLEREAAIPRRYATVARLMEADLRPLKTDSLDEVSRLMDSIRIRLGHARAGRRVRKEEDDVVAKLDKMIEKLEQQAQQARSNAAAGNLQSSQPMPDSMPGGGSGPGNVDPKRLKGQENWGNLPPKERQEALQQLGKEFPSHYREVIEEYFRKLARDDEGNQP